MNESSSRSWDDLLIGIPSLEDVAIDIDIRKDDKILEGNLYKVQRIEDDDNKNDDMVDNDFKAYEKVFDSNLDIFPILKNGIGFPIFIFNILPYLSTIELFTILSISKHLRQVNFSSKVWRNFICRDFSYPSLNEYESKMKSNDYDNKLGSSYHDYRLDYLRRFFEMKGRIENSKLNQEIEKKNLIKQSRIKKVEYFLDLTQVRILIPIILSSFFSSIIMFALYFDGLKINVWACVSPILFTFLYLYCCIFVARLVYNNQTNDRSIFYNMWDNMRGPIRIIFSEGLGESATLTYITCCYTLLFLIEVILLTFKFDPSSTIAQNLSWLEIFIPVWLSYFLYLCLPLYMSLRETDGHGGYIGGIIIFWLPSLVFFICLVVKLSGRDSLHLKAIFMPFWILEGIFMMSTLIYLCIGCSSRQDNRIDETIETFLSTWIIMSPFVIFQSLLSARDDGHNIRSIDAMIPILLCVGWLFLASIISVFRFRSPYDESHAARKNEEAGKRVLYNI